jgi:hypothetical protein
MRTETWAAAPGSTCRFHRPDSNPITNAWTLPKPTRNASQGTNHENPKRTRERPQRTILDPSWPFKSPINTSTSSKHTRPRNLHLLEYIYISEDSCPRSSLSGASLFLERPRCSDLGDGICRTTAQIFFLTHTPASQLSSPLLLLLRQILYTEILKAERRVCSLCCGGGAAGARSPSPPRAQPSASPFWGSSFELVESFLWSLVMSFSNYQSGLFFGSVVTSCSFFYSKFRLFELHFG